MLDVFWLKTGNISSHNITIVCILCFYNSVFSNLHDTLYWSDILVNIHFYLNNLILFIPSIPPFPPHYRNWIEGKRVDSSATFSQCSKNQFFHP